MTKIGLWNRLAIVATGLALLIAPLWMMVDQLSGFRDYKKIEYDFCMSDAEEFLANGEAEAYIETQRKCSHQRFIFDDPLKPGWREWSVGLAATAMVCGIFYILIWLAAWITKWIWRGRKAA